MTTKMTDEGLDLLAQCVSANVAAAGATTDRLLSYKDEQIRRLAALVVKIDDILTGATVIDRATELRLRSLYPQMDSARETLERMMSES